MSSNTSNTPANKNGNHLEEDDEQYKKECDEGCGTILTINQPIMCYSSPDGDLTLCNTCYWDCKYYEDDINPDNEDEICDNQDDYGYVVSEDRKFYYKEKEEESEEESEEE